MAILYFVARNVFIRAIEVIIITKRKIVGKSRLLLCRPTGGLTDSLGVMYKCIQYAKKYNRLLIIDTTLSGLHDSLANYFTLQKPIPGLLGLELTPVLTEQIIAMSTTQPFQKNRNGIEMLQYQTEINAHTKNCIEPLSGEPTSFDLTRDYNSDFLIYHYFGGGAHNAIKVLPYLKLRPEVSQKIVQRTNSFSALKYDATHIRCTDYSIDYQVFLQKLQSKLKTKTLLLCSDNQEVIEYAKNNLHSIELLFTNSFASLDGTPLHAEESSYYTLSQSKRYNLNIDLLTDLYGLSGSVRFHPAILLPSKAQTVKYSGFTILAMHLQKHQTIRNKIFVNND
ncbi:MAG: hypothetical protein QM538_05340 [Methylacidiphilales bacterium]|nr:hypothetical protein [Candidatus Methylacidiphilales bacterium]